MLIYLMRHGDAEAALGGMVDYNRQLTTKGRERTAAAAKILHRLGVDLKLVICSPLVRARQTGEIIAQELNIPLVEERNIGPGCDLARLAETLEAHEALNPVMFIGHEPDFSLMIGELIGRGQVEMRKGAIACISVQGLARGGGVLVWLMSGKDLAALA